MSIQRDQEVQRVLDARLGGLEESDLPPMDPHSPVWLQAQRDVGNTLAALSLLGESDPPEGLADQTIARIAAAKRTNELLRREEMNRRRVYWPTFSLREVSAVAASLLVMAAILVPSLRLASHRAQRQACLSRVGQIGTALSAYAMENDGALPMASGELARWLPGSGDSTPLASPSRGPFRLIEGQFATPAQFLCPAVGGEAFVVRAGMQDFPSSRNIHYSSQYNIGPEPLRVDDPDLGRYAGEMAIFADASPIFHDGRFDRRRISNPTSDNHDGRGQNVLYLDMHGEWATSASVGVANDNIYLVDGVMDYTGSERPRHKTDSFLLPTSIAP